MKQGKRDKYPYATVHFLMAGLGIADPAKYTDHFHLLAHADGSWATCVVSAQHHDVEEYHVW